IYAYIARRATFRRLLVQSDERAGISGDREGAHRTSRFPFVFLHLVDGVEHTPVGVDREEGRVRTGIHRADPLQVAGAPVHPEQIDPFTPCAVGVRTNVEEITISPRLVA